MDRPAQNRLRVLIVDDDQLTARSMESILRKRGFQISGVASSTDQARELNAANQADLLLLDVSLRGRLSGIELAVDFREKYGTPAVFITGYSEDALIDQARRARPVGFIRKPFTDIELAACIEAVSERCLSRERLENHLPGLQAVADQLNQAVILSDIEGQVLMMNDPAVALTGWKREEAQEASLRVIAPLSESVPEPSGFTVSEETAQQKRAVFLTRKNGESIPVEERSSPIRSREGEVIGLVSVFDRAVAGGSLLTPDTEFKDPPARASALAKVASLTKSPSYRAMLPPDAREALDEKVSLSPQENASPSEQPDATALLKMASPLVEDLGDPLLTVDASGYINYANPEALSVFGGEGKLIGAALRDCFEPGDFEAAEEDLSKPLTTGRRHRFHLQDSRRESWFDVRLYRSGDNVLTLFHDITAEKIEEAEAVRQQRLEGLGLLARGFAHDFNNHLTTITGNLSLAKENYQDTESLPGMLEDAQGATNRAAGLVQQLMTFATGGKPIREHVRIPDMLRKILSEHRVRFPEIRYQFQANDADLKAFVDAAQINRLVKNLVSNSEHAMQDKPGALVVRCGKVPPDEIRRFIGGRIPRDIEHLLIEVIDTGPGMEPETLEQVFEPYFTTRKSDNATGIGLTVCESIARAHGGFIFLQSKVGKGTIATFCCPIDDLPLTSETRQVEAVPKLAKAAAESSEDDSPGEVAPAKILILEDDEPILRLMSTTLRRAGHTVVETRDGRETVREYQIAIDEGKPFELVLSDLTIEHGVSGIETMKQLLEIDPHVLAIVSSGYSDATAMADPARYGFCAVLPKPYAPGELRDLVARTLKTARG